MNKTALIFSWKILALHFTNSTLELLFAVIMRDDRLMASQEYQEFQNCIFLSLLFFLHKIFPDNRD